MLTEQFYDILDKELEVVIAENQVDITEKKLNQPEQQKGYALLIWFLKIYAPSKIFKDYITEGKDDSSCDIIFSNKENGEDIFYVVQSKWNKKPKIKEGNQPEKISSDEVKKAIVDFESIFRKDKRKGNNELFNKRLEDLHKHRVENGGAVKFIFLGLLPHNDEVNEHIRNFEANYTPCKLEIMDIERLKRDYIEFKYKQIEVSNPIAYRYFNPTEDKIILPIERIENSMGKGDHLKIEKPYESYILLIKPKTIFDLFQKYRFSLFFNNVRNPLISSHYNKAIVETLNTKPEMFWYYNNGITAISQLIKPIGFDSQIAELRGLQIINGAQTFYSIYAAYKDANEGLREIMDNDAKITLRLIRSSNKDMNLDITRYTNSQNPMEARDFWANDEVQVRLQEESFKTKYWYEKRRGEFRVVPEGVEVIDNLLLARIYTAVWLQEPLLADKMDIIEEQDDLFIFNSQNTNSLYEKVFNNDTTFEKMLSGLLLYKVIFSAFEKKPSVYWIYLTLTKIVFEKYVAQKYNTKANIHRAIKKDYFEESIYTLDRVFTFVKSKVDTMYPTVKQGQSFTTKSPIDNLIQVFEKMNISVEEIDNVDIFGLYREDTI